MSLANSVEARYPFLDTRVYELAARLPTSSKLLGLREKSVLRRWARDVIPPAVRQRPKQPYRAPDIPPFFAPQGPEYVDAVLYEGSSARTGLLDPTAVAGLVRRCRSGPATGSRESHAPGGILSTGPWQRQF